MAIDTTSEFGYFETVSGGDEEEFSIISSRLSPDVAFIVFTGI